MLARQASLNSDIPAGDYTETLSITMPLRTGLFVWRRAAMSGPAGVPRSPGWCGMRSAAPWRGREGPGSDAERLGSGG
jgi:hypothetical protein